MHTERAARAGHYLHIDIQPPGFANVRAQVRDATESATAQVDMVGFLARAPPF